MKIHRNCSTKGNLLNKLYSFIGSVRSPLEGMFCRTVYLLHTVFIHVTYIYIILYAIQYIYIYFKYYKIYIVNIYKYKYNRLSGS